MFEETAARPPRVRRRGAVEMVSIDLLTGKTSETLWLDTLKGIPFIPLTDGWLVALWPKDGVREEATEWAVGNMNTRTGDRGLITDKDEYLPLEDAVKRAEQAIPEAGFALPRRQQNWHASSQAPSEAQLRFARSLRIVGYEDCTRGRLSDEISIVLASRVLDGAVADADVEASA